MLREFKEWLLLFGYSKKTVYKMSLYIDEFLNYLEQNNIKRIEQAEVDLIIGYVNYLSKRSNKKRLSGGLKPRTLNIHLWALNKFKEYVFKYYKYTLPITIRPEKIIQDKLKYLTLDEVKLLFEATKYVSKEECLNQRYKAMMVLLYSCGLRRQEVCSLNVDDILHHRRLLQINNGKNGKQRFIPITIRNLEILQEYLYDGRMMCNVNQSNSFLLGRYGTELVPQTIGATLTKLVKATNNQDLIDKQITPHMLRHSIATHLLDQGMNIEDISQFLGHSSLESTQIYTHINDEDRLC